MITIKETIANVEEYKKPVVKAVVRLIGKDSIKDVVNHGADSGFSGFTYYAETCKFYRRHRKAINQWVIEMAEELGEDPLTMVRNFRCLDSKEYVNDIGRCLFGGKLTEETSIVENALAWFALEESCRLFEE